MENRSAKVFLNGKLDVNANFDKQLLLPEASLLIGRGVSTQKGGGAGKKGPPGYAPSVASSNNSRMSTASFVNGGDPSGQSMTGTDMDDDPEGFVGFLSHVTIHGKSITNRDLAMMMREGEEPSEPVEQDEWSMLVNVNKRLQDDQERAKRKALEQVKLEQKKILDEQVAHNSKVRAQKMRAEREADIEHLSRYNANGDQLQREIAREKREKVAKNRASMSEQRKVEQTKKDIEDKEEMMREREDMRVLQSQC